MMTLPLDAEKNLINRAQTGDATAFEELIAAYTQPLYAVVRRLAQDDQEAEATLQETFWRAWRVLERYKTDKPFLPYLVTIAANYQRDKWRKEKRNFDLDWLSYEMEDAAPSLQQQAETKQMVADLGEILKNLPLPNRMVISLRYDANLSYDQIAEALQLPLNTVRTHLRRAKEFIRTQMGEHAWTTWNET